MNGVDVLEIGAVSMAFLVMLKWALRKWWVKDPSYDFSESFYFVAIPVLNVLLSPLLALLGFDGFVLPTDWVMFVRTALQVFVASLVSLVAYLGYKPLAQYSRNKK